MRVKDFYHFGILASILIASALLLSLETNLLFAAHGEGPGKDKDRTPPVITDLRTESITNNSAIVMWTTDEPADSDIKYGIDPHTNINGPKDPTLVLSHAIALSDLLPETTYAFCVTSRDESKNRTTECGTFVTTSTTEPSTDSGGGGWKPPNQVFIYGIAYPQAHIQASLKQLPLGGVYESSATANSDTGTFSMEFRDFPIGLYSFTITATDKDGTQSVKQGVRFDFKQSNSPLLSRKVVMPPTITLAREVITWGDDIAVFGNTIPHTGVLVEVGDVLYETASDQDGHYEILINSARLTPGKVSIRARSTLISDSSYDYSFSKTVTITSNSVPKADLNADGVVDIRDFSIFISKPTDLNGDKKINATDVSIFLRAF